MRGAHLAPCLLALSACVGARLASVIEQDLVHVTLDGTPFATVHRAAQPRPFVFPVYGPGGVMMTRSFPMAPMAAVAAEATDHPHHQSLWFAHGNVNGFDFWHGTGRRERMQWNGQCVIDQTGAHCRVHCGYRWLVDDDTLVCTDEREFTFGGVDEARTIDVVVTLRPAQTPLVLGDTKEGTFALRVQTALCVEGTAATGLLTNSEGLQNAAAWGQRARWIDDSGTIEGKSVGVAIFDHPSNHGHPTWWHARTYGLLAANPFGVHDFEQKPAGTGTLTVPVGESLRLRYRVLLHGAGWAGPRIEAAYQVFCTE